MNLLTRYIVLIAAACLPACMAFAQPEAGKEINQKDAQGKPDGIWYFTTPGGHGETATTEFGSYDHGLKTGTWYKADHHGEITAIETYKYDVKDGDAKYFENGVLVCAGKYKGLNQSYKVDTLLVTHPITLETNVVYIPTDRKSVLQGTWRFYDPLSGRLIREEEYQADELIDKHEYPLSHSDSLYYSQRNQRLPHMKNGKSPAREQKTPVKSLTGG